MIFNNNTHLYKKISYVLIGGISFALCVLFLFMYIFSTHMTEDLLRKKMGASMNNMVGQLSLPMWNLDHEYVNRLLTDLMRDDDIVSLRLEDTEGRVLEKKRSIDRTRILTIGDKAHKHTHGEQLGSEKVLLSHFVDTKPIVYFDTSDDSQKTLGTLTMVYNNDAFVLSQNKLLGWLVLVAILLFSMLIYIVSSVIQKALKPIEIMVALLNESEEDKTSCVWKLPDANSYEVRQLANAVHAKRMNEYHYESFMQAQLQEVVEARLVSEEAMRAKSEFLANMSHELRTPMHAILNFAKLARKIIPDQEEFSKAIKYMENIQVSGNRLLGLINNLLDLSKMEAGKMDYHFEARDMVTTIEHVEAELEQLFTNKNVQLIKNIKTPATVAEFDAVRIHQVLINLLGNALRYSPEDSLVMVTVEDAYYGNALICTVSDQGVGIPDGEYEAVFDKFIQSSTTNSNSGGTGLGLSICQQIIAAHNGRIWAEPNPTGGAAFKFIIPRKQEELGDVEVSAA